MRKSTSIVAAGAMLIAAACAEQPSSPTEVSRQLAVTAYECNPDVNSYCGSFVQVRTPSDTIPAAKLNHTIVLGEQGLLLFVVNAEDVNMVPGTQFYVATVTGPSDTIPSPVPPGPVMSFYRRFGGTQFAALLKTTSAAGGVVPSDTIPGPGPIGNVMLGNYDADAGQEYAVWVSLRYLANRKVIDENTTALTLILRQGDSFYGAAPVPVFVVNPEKVLTH